MTRKLLAAEPGVTAIFAASDALAFGAMKALIEAGRSIPGTFRWWASTTWNSAPSSIRR